MEQNLVIHCMSSRRQGLIFMSLLSTGVACTNFPRYDSGSGDTVPLIYDAATGTVSDRERKLEGRWRAYGDQYGCPARCTNIGKHPPLACSIVTSPPLRPTSKSCADSAGGASNESLHPDGGAANESCTEEQEEPDDMALVPRTDGRVCTWGVVAKLVKPCESKDHNSRADCTDVAFSYDVNTYDTANIWGAGIMLDFRPEHGDSSEANSPGLGDYAGISFFLEMPEGGLFDAIPANALRVEFPMRLKDNSSLPSDREAVLSDGSVILKDNKAQKVCDYNYDCCRRGRGNSTSGTMATTEEHPFGSPFFRKQDARWTDSTPIKAGHNEISWTKPAEATLDAPSVLPPPEGWKEQYDIIPSEFLSISFHVPAVDPEAYWFNPPGSPQKKATALPYSFCISNLELIR
jgi:hypothetical protein